MSVPRFWNAVGVANDMAHKWEASVCSPVLPMAIGMSTNKTVEVRHALTSSWKKRESCARSLHGSDETAVALARCNVA